MQKWFREERFLSRVAFHLLALVSVSVFWQAGLWFLAWSYQVRVVDLPKFDGALLMLTSAFYLLAAVCLRTLQWHPATNAKYRKWLSQTPWEPTLDLPLSDVMIRWSDVCVMLIAMVTAWIMGVRFFWLLPIVVLLSHTVVVVCMLWRTGAKRDCYLFCFAASLTALLIPHWVWLVPLLGIAEPFKWGAHQRCLAKFPWPDAFSNEESSNEKSVLGFHYEALRSDVSNIETSRSEAFALASLMLFVCLASVRVVGLCPVQPGQMLGGMVIAALAVPIFLAVRRLWLFKLDFRSPISMWGRLGTGRFLIPAHDRVYLVPGILVFIGLGTAAAVSLLRLPGCWLAMGLSAAVWFEKTGKPTLFEWRLTGPIRLGEFSYDQRQGLQSKTT